MTKALLFNIPASGHINPSLPLVKAMIDRGEEVVYVNHEHVRDQVEATGARFIPYPTVDDFMRLMTAAHGNLARNMADLLEIAEFLMPFTIETIEREKPDYIIFDTLCSWAKMAAQKFDKPTIALCTTFVVLPSMMMQMPVKNTLMMVGQMIREMPRGFQTGRRIRNKFDVKPATLPEAVSAYGDITLVFTSSAIQPSSDSFDEHFVFVGAATDLRPATVDFPFDQLTRKPLIYISLGTINNTKADFYRDCFRAFGDHDGQFVMSVGKTIDIATLGDIPENFIVRNFVPQLDILERADVFITHAGMNSTHEAMLNGVPLVAIPQQVEQSFVARQIMNLGAGVAFGAAPPYGTVTVEELREGVNRLLADASYAQKSAQLGESLREAGGAQRAVDVIITYGTTGKRPAN